VEKEAAALLKSTQRKSRLATVTDSFFLMDSLNGVGMDDQCFSFRMPGPSGNFKTKLITSRKAIFLVKKWPIRDAVFLLFVLPCARL